ncbi:MAG TPA: hypothetical protein VJV21_07280 [Pyrinomonadaceae bacterium]|nr:hypothetical protein [Pyrinomonadaceae bacterium]
MLKNIAWETIAKVITVVVATLGLALSVFNAWKARNRLRAGVSVRHLGSAGDIHDFELTLSNIGNVSFSIQQAFHGASRGDADVSEVFYDSSGRERKSFLQPGNLVHLRGSFRGPVREVRRFSVKLSNGRIVTTQFAPNQRYAQNWVAFMLSVFRQHMPEYEVIYWEGLLHGGFASSYEFSDKKTGKHVGGIRGQNPRRTRRDVWAQEVETDDDGATFTHTDDTLLYLIAKRLPDIFEIDSDNRENMQPISADGHIAFVLQYTEAVCDSYGSESGGADFFKKYEFDPQAIVPPRKFGSAAP